MEQSILICPVCGKKLLKEGRTCVCEKGHSFDVARQGYVNLLTVTQKHSKNPGDTRDMVLARREFLSRGYYRPIAMTVAEMLLPVLPPEPVLLDAGCGEGYYLSELMAHYTEGQFLGIDISKEAVRYASGSNKRALWLTASAAHMPIEDSSLDGVMSMFALSVPREFLRVLKPGGFYLEVTSGRGHLMELKKLIYSQITEKQAKCAEKLPGFELFSTKTLEFPLTLTSNEEIMQLLSMTPHVWRITKEGAQRAAQAQMLTDMAQVEFRLYRKIATP